MHKKSMHSVLNFNFAALKVPQDVVIYTRKVNYHFIIVIQSKFRLPSPKLGLSEIVQNTVSKAGD